MNRNNLAMMPQTSEDRVMLSAPVANATKPAVPAANNSGNLKFTRFILPGFRADRFLFDARTNTVKRQNVRIYTAEYNNKLSSRVDIRVSSEFSASEASKIAKQYADALKGLPSKLLSGPRKYINVFKGNNKFGSRSVQLAVYDATGNQLQSQGKLSSTLATELSKLKLPASSAT